MGTTRGGYGIISCVTTGQLQPTGRDKAADYTRHALSKVPEVTAYFWITKVLTTGMGEAASDFLARVFGNVPAVGLGALALAGSLWVQFRAPRYKAPIYWTTVAMVSVFGTMAADVLHVGLGIPYGVSTAFYLIVLLAIFALWYASEKTLSIHSIHTPRRELFYWATVLATFALGTAAGDLTATTLGLGYFSSGILFAVAIAIPARALRRADARFDLGLLAGLHRDPAARRVVRGLDGGLAAARRAEHGARAGDGGVAAGDPRLRGLSGGQPPGRAESGTLSARVMRFPGRRA